MTKIRITADEIKFMNLFEKITGAKVRDMIQEENTICFLVNKEDMGLAIGKKGSNIEKVRNTLGKSVYVIEYSDEYSTFVKNIFQPSTIKEIRISNSSKGKNVVIKTNKRDRKNIIGYQGEKIKLAKKLLDRYFGLKNIIIETN